MVRVIPIGRGTLEDDAVGLATTALARGELVIFPTDTLYALGCRALDAAAAARVRTAKGRDDGKPLPLVIGGAEQLGQLCSRLPRTLPALAQRFWPGPLSLVVPASAVLPEAVTCGSGTVAVRVPALEFARRICGRVGPVISTSANKAGERAPTTCEAAVRGVGEFATLAVDGGERRSAPSTLVDLSGDEPRLLRAGAVPWDAVTAVLRSAAS